MKNNFEIETNRKINEICKKKLFVSVLSALKREKK